MAGPRGVATSQRDSQQAPTNETADELNEAERATETYGRLVAGDPESADFLQNLAVSHNILGWLRFDRGDSNGAEGDFQRYFQVFADLADRDPDNLTYRRELGTAHMCLAKIAEDRRDFDGALADLETARGIFDDLVGRDPENASLRQQLGVCYQRMGEIQKDAGNSEQARQVFDAARRIFARLACQFELARVHRKLGWIEHENRDFSAALAHFEAAVPIFSALVAENAENQRCQQELALSHFGAGVAAKDLDRLEEALAALETARAMHDDFVENAPKNLRLLEDLAEIQSYLGAIRRDLGNSAQALTEFERSREIRTRIFEIDPNWSKNRIALAFAIVAAAKIRHDDGQFTAAEELSAWRDALSWLRVDEKMEARVRRGLVFADRILWWLKLPAQVQSPLEAEIVELIAEEAGAVFAANFRRVRRLVANAGFPALETADRMVLEAYGSPAANAEAERLIAGLKCAWTMDLETKLEALRKLDGMPEQLAANLTEILTESWHELRQEFVSKPFQVVSEYAENRADWQKIVLSAVCHVK